MKLSSDEYLAGTDDHELYCPDCDDITGSNAEPDAEGFHCPDCGGNNAMGLEQAMLLGHIGIDD